MRRTLSCLILAALSIAQTPDQLSTTLPNGKVITFTTVEQKTRFENARAAQAAQAARAQQTANALAAQAATPVKSASDTQMGHTALDDKPTGSGVVNVSAPTFTADYYMLAPETWVGKPVTVSVGYLVPSEGAARKDGMRKLEAFTWGTTSGLADQRSGGTLTVLAPPEISVKLLQQCGTRYQYLGWTYKTTLIKGVFTDLSKSDPSVSGSGKYGLTVEK